MTNNPEDAVTIIVDDLQGPEIAALLRAHLAFTTAHSPMESMHALNIDSLRQDDITFWTAWQARTLVGCIALSDLGDGHGEIKSMHTAEAARGKGVAQKLVAHLIEAAEMQSYHRLSLETRTPQAFKPARALYERFGFEECPPFAAYVVDPYSVFMTKVILRGE